MEEMRATILVEVSTLGEIMPNLYEEFLTIHKSIVCLHELQKQNKDFVKTLKNVKFTITYLQ